MPTASYRRTAAARAADQISARCTAGSTSTTAALAATAESTHLPRAPTYTYTYTLSSPCHRCLMCPHVRPTRTVS